MKNDWKGDDWDALTEEERNERFYNREIGFWQAVGDAIGFTLIFAILFLALYVCD